MMEPLLRSILLSFLFLTRCSFFTIDPQQRKILLNQVGMEEDLHSVIKMSELLANNKTTSEFDSKQLDRLEAMIGRNLTRTSK